MSSSSIYGSAASPITISGLGSGLNTSGIITALTANENTAITTYQESAVGLEQSGDRLADLSTPTCSDCKASPAA